MMKLHVDNLQSENSVREVFGRFYYHNAKVKTIENDVEVVQDDPDFV